MKKYTLKDIGEVAEGLFYQDYATRDAFFDEQDFIFHFATEYSAIFEAAFQIMRKQSKQENWHSVPEISAAWLWPQTAEVKANVDGYFYAELPIPIYAFGYDEFSFALDSVKITGPCKSHCKLKKISRMEVPYIEDAATTGLTFYWLASNNSIAFTRNVTQVTAMTVPSVLYNDDNCVLNESMVAEAITKSLNKMFGAKNGNIVDETNDANKNNVVQQQTNPQLNKQ